jgi:hypothetical protein
MKKLLKQLSNKKIFKVLPLDHWEEYTEEEHQIQFLLFIFKDGSRYKIEACHAFGNKWIEVEKVEEEKPSYPEFYKRGRVG